MKLDKLERNWDAFGEQDPLWAILSDPAKKGGRWVEDEFFATGKQEIDSVMDFASSLPVKRTFDWALDFGCGVGRLTQALCDYFKVCYGIDIAISMIQKANQYNKFGSRCKYILNTKDDLSIFDDNFFNFIYSRLVLQHMEPIYSTAYIKEFLRILSPGGLLIFQIPTEYERPISSEVLPDAAFKAKLSIKEKRLKVHPGVPTILSVGIQNKSSIVWPDLRNGNYPLKLGNHWLSKDKKIIVNDDGRTEIPCKVLPSQKIEVKLEVVTPLIPGDYILELDMVQEAVAWFKQKGSMTAKILVRVDNHPNVIKSATQNSKPENISSDVMIKSPTFIPTMELYGIRREIVLDLVQLHGGKVLDVHEEGSLGGWASFLYSVTKD